MTFNCSVTAVYTAEEGKSGVTIIPESPITGTQQVHFSAVVDGVVSAKGYAQSDLESFASTIIKGSSGSIPSGVYLAASSGEASGSETRMNLTSVIQRSSSAEGNVYEIHGTMDVKLMQVYPAEAPGSVIARFEF
jgi:hypothetical protein